MLKLKEWIEKISQWINTIESKRLSIVRTPLSFSNSLCIDWKSVTAVTNSSGLINLTDAAGVDPGNCAGLYCMCLTPQYKISGVTRFNNWYYAIVSPYNSATPVGQGVSIGLLVSWFHTQNLDS